MKEGGFLNSNVYGERYSTFERDYKDVYQDNSYIKLFLDYLENLMRYEDKEITIELSEADIAKFANIKKEETRQKKIAEARIKHVYIVRLNINEYVDMNYDFITKLKFFNSDKTKSFCDILIDYIKQVLDGLIFKMENVNKLFDNMGSQINKIREYITVEQIPDTLGFKLDRLTEKYTKSIDKYKIPQSYSEYLPEMVKLGFLKQIYTEMRGSIIQDLREYDENIGRNIFSTNFNCYKQKERADALKRCPNLDNDLKYRTITISSSNARKVLKHVIKYYFPLCCMNEDTKYNIITHYGINFVLYNDNDFIIKKNGEINRDTVLLKLTDTFKIDKIDRRLTDDEIIKINDKSLFELNTSVQPSSKLYDITTNPKYFESFLCFTGSYLNSFYDCLSEENHRMLFDILKYLFRFNGTNFTRILRYYDNLLIQLLFIKPILFIDIIDFIENNEAILERINFDEIELDETDNANFAGINFDSFKKENANRLVSLIDEYSRKRKSVDNLISKIIKSISRTDGNLKKTKILYKIFKMCSTSNLLIKKIANVNLFNRIIQKLNNSSESEIRDMSDDLKYTEFEEFFDFIYNLYDFVNRCIELYPNFKHLPYVFKTYMFEYINKQSPYFPVNSIEIFNNLFTKTIGIEYTFLDEYEKIKQSYNSGHVLLEWLPNMKYNTISFTDCGDINLLNIFTFILIDGSIFKQLDKLPPSLNAFFTKYNTMESIVSADTTNKLEFRQEWYNIIENLSFPDKNIYYHRHARVNDVDVYAEIKSQHMMTIINKLFEGVHEFESNTMKEFILYFLPEAIIDDNSSMSRVEVIINNTLVIQYYEGHTEVYKTNLTLLDNFIFNYREYESRTPFDEARRIKLFTVDFNYERLTELDIDLKNMFLYGSFINKSYSIHNFFNSKRIFSNTDTPNVENIKRYLLQMVYKYHNKIKYIGFNIYDHAMNLFVLSRYNDIITEITMNSEIDNKNKFKILNNCVNVFANTIYFNSYYGRPPVFKFMTQDYENILMVGNIKEILKKVYSYIINEIYKNNLILDDDENTGILKNIFKITVSYEKYLPLLILQPPIINNNYSPMIHLKTSGQNTGVSEIDRVISGIPFIITNYNFISVSYNNNQYDSTYVGLLLFCLEYYQTLETRYKIVDRLFLQDYFIHSHHIDIAPVYLYDYFNKLYETYTSCKSSNEFTIKFHKLIYINLFKLRQLINLIHDNLKALNLFEKYKNARINLYESEFNRIELVDPLSHINNADFVLFTKEESDRLITLREQLNMPIRGGNTSKNYYNKYIKYKYKYMKLKKII